MPKLRAVLVVLLLVASCSSTYNITSKDGSKSAISGKLMNGAVSYSSGPGCTPTQPSPSNPAPTPPPALLVQKQVCDPNGGNCKMAMMQAEATAPACDTQIVNVHSTDLTNIFAWLFGGGLSTWALAAASGT